jgi:hypothetical protein
VDEHAIGAVSLEVEDEMVWQEERESFEDGDGTLDLVTMDIRRGVRDVGVKETEWGGKRSADGF